ncbi:hypothetical protein SDC9_203350 [bioreactor metagenome]|uniref:Uncharacterized protein n=1 Tax=bioreactor metagenome TaxID=1076179 RepID=A0A645IWV4_9ZZZZ
MPAIQEMLLARCFFCLCIACHMGIDARLRIEIAMQKQRIVGNGLFDQLLDQKELRCVDDGVDTLLKCLNRCESLKRITQ